MARRARTRRGEDTAATAAPPSPYVKRQMPFFDVIDEDTIQTLERQVDWLLQEVGIEFRDDPEAHRIWQEAGVKLDGTRVRADAAWIRELCAKAPREFTQLARNPERSVTIGGANQVFAPIYGAPFVRDGCCSGCIWNLSCSTNCACSLLFIFFFSMCKIEFAS